MAEVQRHIAAVDSALKRVTSEANQRTTDWELRVRTALDEIVTGLGALSTEIARGHEAVTEAGEVELGEKLAKVTEGYKGFETTTRWLRDNLLVVHRLAPPSVDLATTLSTFGVALRENLRTLAESTDSLETALSYSQQARVSEAWCAAPDEVFTDVWDNESDADAFDHL